MDTKANCRHLKKLTCKGTLRQVFIRVYRLEIQYVMLIFFDPALWTVAPLSFSLVPQSPFACVNKYTVYTCTVCKGGGEHGVLGLRQINTCRSIFFRWQHFALPSMSLIFLRYWRSPFFLEMPVKRMHRLQGYTTK